MYAPVHSAMSFSNCWFSFRFVLAVGCFFESFTWLSIHLSLVLILPDTPSRIILPPDSVIGYTPCTDLHLAGMTCTFASEAAYTSCNQYVVG